MLLLDTLLHLDLKVSGSPLGSSRLTWRAEALRLHFHLAPSQGNDLQTPSYSSRKATMGSTLAARRAGIQHARKADLRR
jgi:hypothetical protein